MSTVRKALAMLSSDALITQRRGSGTYVAATISPDPMSREKDGSTLHVSPHDVLESFAAIEPGFADIVVVRGTQDDFSLMELWLDQARKAPDQREFRTAMRGFHEELARTTRNVLLVRLFGIVMDARARVGWKALKLGDETPEQRGAIVKSFEEVLVALRDRDANLSRELLHKYL
jgi:DNA-binding FadR family transcriptional regulator